MLSPTRVRIPGVSSRRPGQHAHWALGALALLLAAGARAQAINEFPILPKRLLYGITAGPDGAMWFTDFDSGVGRMTTGGAVTQFSVGGNPEGIVTGPDGNLWFADIGFSQIGRITTSGTVTRYPVAGGTAQIIVGPDGALWFTDQSANKIGRITTAGAVTEFSMPASGTPVGIAAGSDGNLWFTEFSSGKIGRVTTAGVFTEFPIPTASSGPMSIAAGPDGNLWFTESNASKIGRITTAGVITEFPLPSTTRSFSIVPGPDGNLWFTEFDANRIGRITTAGEITEFFVTTSASNPLGIAAGPDGNLWFTEFNASQIGRVRPPAATPGANLYSLTPCRVIDTRNPTGPRGGPALVAGADRLFFVAGTCGIPATARAVVVNATVTQGSAAGHLTTYPGGSTLPPAVTTINYSAGQTRANNGVLSVGSGGYFFVHCEQSSGSVQFILDVSGYFQ